MPEWCLRRRWAEVVAAGRRARARANLLAWLGSHTRAPGTDRQLGSDSRAQVAGDGRGGQVDHVVDQARLQGRHGPVAQQRVEGAQRRKGRLQTHTLEQGRGRATKGTIKAETGKGQASQPHSASPPALAGLAAALHAHLVASRQADAKHPESAVQHPGAVHCRGVARQERAGGCGAKWQQSQRARQGGQQAGDHQAPEATTPSTTMKPPVV